MRCARLLTLLAGSEPLDRTGAGLVAEVYPAAALRQWQLDPRGYKDRNWRRRRSEPSSSAPSPPQLPDGSTSTPSCKSAGASDHLLDALLAALLARAIERGQTLPILAAELEAARGEGWIHLPRAQPLADFHPFAQRAAGAPELSARGGGAAGSE